jgi:hypothetical protein
VYLLVSPKRANGCEYVSLPQFVVVLTSTPALAAGAPAATIAVVTMNALMVLEMCRFAFTEVLSTEKARRASPAFVNRYRRRDRDGRGSSGRPS